MAEGNNYPQKEKVTGVYLPTAAQIKFNKTWSDHTFTEDEIQKLLAGETISFPSKTKAGNDYIATGKLEERELNGFKFWGFNLTQDSIPAQWSGHTFTAQERETLANGGNIYVQDCVSKKSGKTFACTLSWGEENGRKRLIPSFNNNH